MSDLVTIGSSAIDIYRRALATTGNNIANLNTEGYSRQEVSIGQAVTREVGGLTFGTGAKLEGIRRMFDAFVEVSLRSSISSLETQTPMVSYGNRVVDLLGDQVAGLSPVMDGFFASALELSQDPASRILRDRFLRSADDLARRFGELSAQLDILEAESRGQIREQVESLTVLGRQLAAVNKELNRKLSIEKQSPALLDERDRILRELSAIARINVTETPNGMVSVSLTDSVQGLFVDGLRALEVGAEFDPSDVGKVSIIVDPRGNSRAVVSGLQSGTLGGLMSFREQVLQPTSESLDFLALAMAREINAIHRSGVDYNGNVGADLFAIDPVFSAVSPAQRLNVRVDVEVVDPAALRFRDVEFTYDDSRKIWIARDTVTGARTLSEPVVGEVARMSLNGLEVRISGRPADAENFMLKAENRPATGLRLAISEPFEVAAADLFRSIRSEDNLGSAEVRVRYDALSLPAGGGLPIDQVFANSQSETRFFDPRIGLDPDEQGNPLRAALVGVIPAGFRDVDLFLAGAADSGLQIQLITRDGRHVLGGGDLSSLLSPENAIFDLGFERNATYSDLYLNRSDTSPYKNLELFYGVRAAPVVTGRYQAIDPVVSGGQILPAGALVINGKPLGALTVPPGSSEITAGEIAAWINANRIPGVSASGLTEIRVPPNGFDRNQPLRLNGFPINLDAAGVTNAPSSWVAAINRERDITGVEARLNLDGSIVLQAQRGGNIRLEPEQNALGIRGDTVITGRLVLNSLDFIDIGFGSESQAGVNVAETLRRLGIETVPATIESGTVPGAIPTGGEIFGEGALRLNGAPMPALQPAGAQLEASDVAAWFNSAGVAGLSAVASTLITVPRSQLDLRSGLTLQVGDSAPVVIAEETPGGGWQNVNALVQAINDRFDDTGILARLGADGALLIEQTAGRTVRVSANGFGNNALGLGNDSLHRGRYTVESRFGPIRLTLGETGRAADLATIGLRANAHVDGVLDEDLLVFVTGNGTGTLSAEYTTGEADRVGLLRASPLDIRFDSESSYSIIDVATQTVLAERSFQFGEDPVIRYQGLQIEFTARPRTGDRFRIDGNQDGIGNNANIRRLAELQESRVLAGGLTFTDSYQQTVSIVANQARQATLARDALRVVNEQAVEARDRVSGVSLDEEAANLVRFQQAFQAAARIIQTANQIFDAILAIR